MSLTNCTGTTLIIGNGFDLNLGMNTGYRAFFERLDKNGFFKEYNRNPLLSYIYEKGAKENWYAFEEIIRDFAFEGSQAQTIAYCHKMLETVKKIQGFEDDALCKIPNFKDLNEFIPSLRELINVCNDVTIVNLSLQNTIRPICDKIRKEANVFFDSVRRDCTSAIELLSKQLNIFIKEAMPQNKYSAGAKILCALLGCDGKGYLTWSENLALKYNKEKSTYFFPKCQIVSFNYTNAFTLVLKTIETLSGRALFCGSSKYSESIYNIHGTLDNNIAFGTDEDNRIPKELWCLRKSSVIGENVKLKFHEILCNSNRIVIFGHSIHGIDFEYYKDYFNIIDARSDIYILSHTQDSLDEIKRGLEFNGVSVKAKYILADIYDDKFLKLCNEINMEQCCMNEV